MYGETVVVDEVVDHSIQGIRIPNPDASLNITLNQLDNAVEFGVRELKFKCPGLKCAMNQCFLFTILHYVCKMPITPIM